MMRMAERVFALILSLALPGVASGVGEGAVSVPVGTTGTNGASKLPEVTITATRLSIDPFDLSVGWRSNDRRRWASASIENVADMTYRQLGSGEDAPGLNFVFAGGVRF